MRRILSVAVLLGVFAASAEARGLLIPVEKTLPPLAMLNHRVNVSIEDQVAVTKVEQTFRNHTARELEATYVFPVPKGASVKEFAMWVDGKRVKGELLPAAEARKVYTEIVRQTQDPGLLEYIGSDMLSLKIFPVPAKGEQKVEVSYTSVAKKDHEVVEYTYPLKTDGKSASTLEDFTLKVSLKSQHPIVNIYSPTHAINANRTNDREAVVGFEKDQAILDKDFQLFYTTSGKDVGLTALAHRPVSSEDGYVMMLISPRAELSKDQQVPRDMIFVLDTSGSMLADGKMEQAKKALKHCIDGLSEKDRFAVINFSTTVNRYRDNLVAVSKDQIADAKKWVEKLEATGGTAINDALAAAMELQGQDTSRTFTVVFFTDGKPTIGETNPDKILSNVRKKNAANTRIFTFGVGNDVNASMLDQIAEQSRAISSYVRPEEDIEVKVSHFFGKINRPVLANLKIAAGSDLRLVEVYPPQLPDLFHGDQLVVLGRFQGSGHAAVTLTGTVGKETKEFVYEIDFPIKLDGKAFVEDLWARRKVGYLMEQIRLNGEKDELVKETTALAKKYGIATPYTSWLIVPDAAMPVADGRPGKPRPEPNDPDLKILVPGTATSLPFGVPGGGWGGGGFGGGGIGGGPGRFPSPPPALRLPGTPAGGSEAPIKLEDAARFYAKPTGDTDGAKLGDRLGLVRDEFDRRQAEAIIKALERRTGEAKGTGKDEEAEGLLKRLKENEGRRRLLESTVDAIRKEDRGRLDTGKSGVDLTIAMQELKYEQRQRLSALQRVNGRKCLEIGGIFIDDEFGEKTPAVTVKYLSDAYFRILEKYPEMKDVFRLGGYLIWITPSGTALIVDAANGKDKLADAEIDQLFTAKK